MRSCCDWSKPGSDISLFISFIAPSLNLTGDCVIVSILQIYSNNLQLNAKLGPQTEVLTAVSSFTLFLRINKSHGSINGQSHYFSYRPADFSFFTFSIKDLQGRKAKGRRRVL